MEVNGQRHALIALPMGKESLVPIHVGRAPELVFMFLRTEKSVATGGI
jgi:hypothetical protein